jgi:hypothetical protein
MALRYCAAACLLLTVAATTSVSSQSAVDSTLGFLIRQEKETNGKCGKKTCADGENCAFLRFNHSKKGKFLTTPKCVASNSTVCEKANVCLPGYRCATAKYSPKGPEYDLCVPSALCKRKELVGGERCGKKTCGPTSQCAQVVSNEDGSPSAPPRCILISTKACQHGGKASQCPKARTCAMTKILSTNETPHLCVPSGMCRRKESPPVPTPESGNGKCLGGCPAGDACRLTMESASLAYRCRPKTSKPCFANVFCLEGSKCGHIWEKDVWVRKCVPQQGCGSSSEPCKANEKCEGGNCVAVEEQCGEDGACENRHHCRAVSIRGKTAKQCLPASIGSCGEGELWCARGHACVKTSFGKEDCKPLCGASVCKDDEQCKMTDMNEGQTSSDMQFKCIKRKESCQEECEKKSLTCAKVFSIKSGKGGFTSECVEPGTQICGEVAVCADGLSCKTLTSKATGRTYDRCVEQKVTIQSTTSSFSGTCSCVTLPKCYTSTCSEVNCNAQTGHVCLEDLKSGGVSLTDVYGVGSFGLVETCSKKGRTRQLFFKSLHPDHAGQCVSDTVVQVVKRKIDSGGGGGESGDTCHCEQDPGQKPGLCHFWLNPGVDKSCYSRTCQLSWRCVDAHAQGDSPTNLCRKVKVTEKIEPTYVEGECKAKKVNTNFLVRVEV